MNKRVTIMKVPLDSLSFEEAIERIETFIKSRQPHQVTTVNPEFVLDAQQNPEFLKVLQEADLSLADGTGVTWAARYTGHPLPDRIPGADLVEELARLSDSKDWKIYLVGAGRGVAQLAADKLKKLHPGVKIVGAEEGLTIDIRLSETMGGDHFTRTVEYNFNQEKVEALIKRIRSAKPDILLVAFGAPKQDLFIARYKKELNVPAMIGVGGTFDYLAGKVTRAPGLLRSLGLEWLWRLFKEPKRANRIFKAIFIFPCKIIFNR